MLSAERNENSGPAPSETLVRQRVQIGPSGDPSRLGVTYPTGPHEGIRLHFFSNDPTLGLRYATKNNAWSTDEHVLDARNTITSRCDERYSVAMKRLPDGRFEFNVQFDPLVAGARISISGQQYFIAAQGSHATARIPAARGAVRPVPITPKTNIRATSSPRESEEAQTPTIAPPLLPLAALGERIQPIPKDQTRLLSNQSFIEFPRDSVIPRINILNDYVGDYHVPPAGEREGAAVRSILALAEGALPEETKKSLANLFSQKSLVEGSKELRDLFRQNLAAINEQKAREVGIAPLSEEFKTSLGIPAETRAFLSLSGGRPLGMSEADVREAIKHGYESILRHGRHGEALVDRDDVVVFQAYTDQSGGPICLGMTTLTGGLQGRENWTASTYDASFQAQPFTHVHNQIFRNPNAREETFSAWAEKHARWLTPGGDLEIALAQKDQMIAATAEAARQAKLLREQKAEASGKQDKLFAEISPSEYRLGFLDSVIVERVNRHGSMSASTPAQTGSYEVGASADLQFEIIDSKGKLRNIHLQSVSQVDALSEVEKKAIEFALTTPLEGDSTRSISRVVDLFPSENYRPGWVASWFYSPSYSRRNMLDGLEPIYRALHTPEEQRDFLKTVYGELRARKAVTSESAEALIRKLSPSQ